MRQFTFYHNDPTFELPKEDQRYVATFFSNEKEEVPVENRTGDDVTVPLKPYQDGYQRWCVVHPGHRVWIPKSLFPDKLPEGCAELPVQVDMTVMGWF